MNENAAITDVSNAGLLPNKLATSSTISKKARAMVVVFIWLRTGMSRSVGARVPRTAAVYATGPLSVHRRLVKVFIRYASEM